MGFGSTSVALDGDLRRALGADDQLVSVERAILTEGTGLGEPVLLVRNPAGVSFEVLLDRAMDLGWAQGCGVPLAWRSPRGRAAASRYEPTGSGWCQTFGGGLLATCGLAATGAPSAVDDVNYGLHGRIGHVPAEHVTWRLTEVDGALAVEIAGDVVEAGLGTPTLRLHRTILAWCDRPVLRVRDVVTNESYASAGHMFRHHVNLGYPLVTDGTVVSTGAVVFGERDADGVPDAAGSLRLSVAEGVVPERVLYARSPDGVGRVGVGAPEGLGLDVTYDAGAFPFLLLWRDASAGVNVLGVEPSTSRDGGRARAERDGEVIWLEPGEARGYWTQLALAGSPSPSPS